ncbi:MAG: hypothetical protein Q9163_005261 [Psora crenata]
MESHQRFPVPTKHWLPLTAAPADTRPGAICTSLADGLPGSLPIHPGAPNANVSMHPDAAALTPPATPDKAEMERKRSSLSIDSANLVSAPTEELKSMLLVGVGLGADPKEMVMRMVENGMDVGPLAQVPEMARPYKRNYQLQAELGHGAWSTVYSASEVLAAPWAALPPSPPSTPGRSPGGSTKDLLAVKAPTRRDGRKVLEKEARILTYIHSHAESRNYLVPFLGFDETRSSIIFEAVPLTLQTHVKNAGKALTSTSTMFNPIIGAPQWADLAICLISGLAFLQGKGCVHGDIKPANILLRPDTQGKMAPLFCDFSSSHVLSLTSNTIHSTQVEEISAVTTDYTSPELLESLHRRRGSRAVATYACDVFALAVTLIFAAAGESPYAGAQMEVQKLAMAREGVPLEFARSGAQCSRVMRRKAVDMALKGAVEKDVEKRVVVKDWERLVRDVAGRWKDAGWVNGG